MQTFSDIVDRVAKDLGKRPSEDIANCVNYAIRDVEKSSDTPLIYVDDYCPAPGHNMPILWTIPDIRQFIRLVYVEDADGTPAEEVRPSAALASVRRSGLPYYWQAGTCITFANFKRGAKFTWSAHSPWFQYHKTGERPEFNGDLEHPNFYKVTSLTLCALDHLIIERAKQKIKNNTNDPGAGNQDRETARVNNFHQATL